MYSLKTCIGYKDHQNGLCFYHLGIVSECAVYGWTSLVTQWLRLHTASTRGAGSLPGQGTRIPHVTGLKE